LQAFSALTQIEAWSPRPPIYQIKVNNLPGPHKSLYPQSGPVVPLIGEEIFNQILEATDTIWIVEYYDDSCPHCWYFSSIYPIVAKAIKSQKVRVGAFNCLDSANGLPCQRAGVKGYPAVVVYNAQGPGSHSVLDIQKNGNPDDPLPAKAMAESLQVLANGRIPVVRPEAFQTGAGLVNTGHLVNPNGPPGKIGWPDEPWGTVRSRFHDAHIGMARLLADGYVSKSKYQAALNVVQFVGRAFGKDESEAFSDLMNKLTKTPNMEPVHFRAVVMDWAQQFNTKWAFCQTKTCAVWQLFHGISSLIAIRYAPIQVAEALPKYRFMVDHFLDCDVCTKHFVESYDNCLFGRCEVLSGADEPARAKALLLWIWRVHNAVSARVVSEHPPKGEAIDRRWPTFHDCPGCWKSSVVNGRPAPELTFASQQNHQQPIYAVFDESKVFGFLLFTYLGAENARLFQMPAVPFFPHYSSEVTAVVNSQMMLVLMCAVAGLASLVIAVRRFGSLRPSGPRGVMAVPTDEEALLELAETPELVD